MSEKIKKLLISNFLPATKNNNNSIIMNIIFKDRNFLMESALKITCSNGTWETNFFVSKTCYDKKKDWEAGEKERNKDIKKGEKCVYQRRKMSSHSRGS